MIFIRNTLLTDEKEGEDSVAYREAANVRIRAATKSVAEKFNCIFVPLYDKIKENAERSRMEYFIWDGTHPTIAGHMIIAREWLKAVEE